MRHLLFTFLACLAAVTVGFVGYEQYKAWQVRTDIDNRRRAYLVHAIASVTPAQLSIEQMFQMDAELPCPGSPFAERGIEQPKATRTYPAPRLVLSGCGEVTVWVEAQDRTEAGHIVVRSRPSDNDLDWECLTPSYPDIGELVAGCAYDPAAVQAPPGPLEIPVAASEAPRDGCTDQAVLYRSLFTDAVVDRVALNRLVELDSRRREVLFFTEIIGGAGSRVTHEWFHDGEHVATVPFDVGGDRWRTWSSKNIGHLGAGRLEVRVREGDCLVGRESVRIADADSTAPAEAPFLLSGSRQIAAFALGQAAEGNNDFLSTLRYVPRGEIVRFSDGDTPLLRAVRSGTRPAVAELLALAREAVSRGHARTLDILHDYDAGGQQAIDVARNAGDPHIVKLIESALEKHPWPPWAVSRATFARAVVDGEPVKCRNEAWDDESTLTFFAEVMGLRGQRITHEWSYSGSGGPAVRKSIPFDVGSDRWTTQSTIAVEPQQLGRWDIRVRDESGRVLYANWMTYRELDDVGRSRRESYDSGRCVLDSDRLLTMAAAHVPIADLEYLLEHGVRFEDRDGSLMKIAIESGNISLVRWLLDRGVSADGFRGGDTPLTMAAERGDGPMVMYLLSRGADPSLRSRGRQTPLEAASLYAGADITRLLLEYGGDPNASRSGIGTALSQAVSNCKAETIALLLSHGAKPKDPEEAERLGNYAGSCVTSGAWDADHDTNLALLELIAAAN